MTMMMVIMMMMMMMMMMIVIIANISAGHSGEGGRTPRSRCWVAVSHNDSLQPYNLHAGIRSVTGINMREIRQAE